jgi:hypothetical protein
MSTMLEKRVAALEQRTGIVADPFIEHLSEDDAGVYGAVMRRWSASRQGFEVFIRGLDRGELERLLQMHLEVLGMTDDELRAMGETVSKLA